MDYPQETPVPEEQWNPPGTLKPIPSGLFERLDYFLQSPEEITQRLRERKDLPELARTFLLLSVLNCAIYGAVMGASNLLQGADMALWQKLALIFTTAIKVPTLFLLTLLIVLPPIYVSNSFSGARLSFPQVLATLLGSIALASTLLASLATVAVFFSITTLSYNFIKLLHVGFFAYAGTCGVMFLTRQFSAIGTAQRRTPVHLQLAWMLLYIFVGTQLAWVLRPFIASPNEPFQIFRDRSGSFYEAVHRSAWLLITGERETPPAAEPAPQESAQPEGARPAE